MDDVRAAMLGDKEAARRLTDAGVLLPCWRCESADGVMMKRQMKMIIARLQRGWR